MVCFTCGQVSASNKRVFEGTTLPGAKRPYPATGGNAPRAPVRSARALYPQQMHDLATRFNLSPLLLQQVMAEASAMLESTPACEQLQQVLRATMDQNRQLQQQVSDHESLIAHLKGEVDVLRTENQTLQRGYSGEVTSSQRVFNSNHQDTSQTPSEVPHQQSSGQGLYRPADQVPSRGQYQPLDRGSTQSSGMSDYQHAYTLGPYSVHSQSVPSANAAVHGLQQYSSAYVRSAAASQSTQGTERSQYSSQALYSAQPNAAQYSRYYADYNQYGLPRSSAASEYRGYAQRANPVPAYASSSSAS